MADEPIQAPVTAAPVAAEPVAAPSPVATTPPPTESLAAPATETAVVPQAAVAEAPSVETAKLAEAEKPATEAKAVEPEKPAPSLLSEAGKDPAKDGEAAKPVDPAAEIPLPTFEPWILPEGMSLGEKEVGTFNTLLGEFARDTKVDQRLVQEHGQKLVDMFLGEVSKLRQAQVEAWKQTRANWVKEVKEDAVLGRNRFDTVMRDAARVRDMFATERTMQLMDDVGAGDHAGTIDLFHNIARFLDKHGLLREGTPVIAQAPNASKGVKTSGPRARYRNPSTGA